MELTAYCIHSFLAPVMLWLAWTERATAFLLLVVVGSPWPFRVAVAVVVLADLEEIAITAVARRKQQQNVTARPMSVWLVAPSSYSLL